MKIVQLKPTTALPEAAVWAMAKAKTFVTDAHYDLLIRGEDTTVLKPDGSPLLVLRCRVLPAEACRLAFPGLLDVAVLNDNRSGAAGPLTLADLPPRGVPIGTGNRFVMRKLDGTLSKRTRGKSSLSGVAGYYQCRTTAYTTHDVQGWYDILPFISAANAVFRRGLPIRYAAQMEAVRQTPPQLVIPGTAFTTVTVNRNFQTVVHKDKRDLKAGFGVMSVIRAGHYEGGYLVLPKYRIAVDMQSTDVLLADVHEWHGNTAIIGREGEFDRISTVFYYRANMRYCSPP